MSMVYFITLKEEMLSSGHSGPLGRGSAKASYLNGESQKGAD
jgi:hypothetical protein